MDLDGSGPAHLSEPPFVGRSAELADLQDALDAVAAGRGRAWIVAGEAGIGKTRLGAAVLDEAARRGWATASGRAFPVESGIPYALLGDALLPTVRRLEPATVASLTRGVGELTRLFPWLGDGAAAAQRGDEGWAGGADFLSRLYWHFTQFLRELASRQPLVVVLEDLQWADSSSMELLHFVLRQLMDAPLFVYCTFNPAYRDSNAALRAFEESLSDIRGAEVRQLEPLTEAAVTELVARLFDADPSVTQPFAATLHERTQGNAFFLMETLEHLVAVGELRQVDGRWEGWSTDARTLPPSVRDAVLRRVSALSGDAREVADVAAVIGARFGFGTLGAVLGSAGPALLEAVDELRRAGILREDEDSGEVIFDFVHPLMRETLYADLGRLRTRLLHGAVAEALERRFGGRALEHADELAYHFSRTQANETEEKAIVYLAEAGRRALAKYANREAVDYLSAGLERMEHCGVGDDELVSTVCDLARARQRLGDYEEAAALWRRAQEGFLRLGDADGAAGVDRHMGLACFWTGRHAEALGHFESGLARAVAGGDMRLAARILTAYATCLQELGRADDALAAAERALDIAGPGAPPALLAGIHRTFLQLNLWKGEAELARMHAARALELAHASGDLTSAFMAHWGSCLLEGFSGNATEVEHHIDACERLASDLRSPVLRVWAAELKLEYASARGDWDAALAIGQDSIGLARALQQRTLLPRLLVWTALIHLGRSELERAEALIAEAWETSGAESHAEAGANIHAVVAAYIGRASLCMAREDFRGAIRTGQAGIELADRAGYTTWVVHRLLPIVAEAYLWLRELEGARVAGARLRREAGRLGHRLGLAWADACDALVVWLSGNSAQGAVLLRQAAEGLEALPFMPDATRIRRQLAGRLAELGDREGAARELREVHDRLLRLGAERELQKARAQFRELGVRPPPRSGGRVSGILSAREAEIAGLAAAGSSSKAVARALRVSVRTVDAHLANIYRKLAIGSRAELREALRGRGAPGRA
jgi:DNA-binding CsgD family transcriptional regulator/tetratricopeptide (TPR) repeat protein